MARPTKKGLDYFPLDVDIDQDDKFQLIEALHGVKGFGITIKLLMRIYKEGFFYHWTETEQILFARRVNEDINTVKEVVNDCIKYSLFNSDLYDQFSVLTSHGIQARYFEAISRRKDVNADETYILVNLENYPNVNRKAVNVNINSVEGRVNADIGTQSKVKESKGKNKVPPATAKKPAIDENSNHYILAKYMYKKIKINNPDHKEPNFKTWSEDFRKILDIDRRDKNEVASLIKWVQADDFEMVNVLSPSKLRKRYDQLMLKMKKDPTAIKSSTVNNSNYKDLGGREY